MRKKEPVWSADKSEFDSVLPELHQGKKKKLAHEAFSRRAELLPKPFASDYIWCVVLARFTWQDSSSCKRGRVGNTLIFTGLANPVDEYRSCVHEDNSIERGHGSHWPC